MVERGELWAAKTSWMVPKLDLHAMYDMVPSPSSRQICRIQVKVMLDCP